MTDDRPLPKTYAWNLNKHPRCCVECGKEFKRGDRVYPICAVAIHAGCRLDYIRTCKSLGIKP